MKKLQNSTGTALTPELYRILPALNALVFDGDPSRKPVVFASVDLGDRSRTVEICLEVV
jgi:hypothetical protein